MEAVMVDVRKFGRWPEQHAPSEQPGRETERLLAQRVAKMKAAACLPPAVVTELEELEAERRDGKTEEIMAEVLELGRWPLLRRLPRNSKQEVEHKLARRVRTAMRSGPLSKANSALLDEFRWEHHRRQDAKQLDTHQHRLTGRRRQARRQALARASRMRILLRMLGQSRRRCTCRDFDCWAPL